MPPDTPPNTPLDGFPSPVSAVSVASLLREPLACRRCGSLTSLPQNTDTLSEIPAPTCTCPRKQPGRRNLHHLSFDVSSLRVTSPGNAGGTPLNPEVEQWGPQLQSPQELYNRSLHGSGTGQREKRTQGHKSNRWFQIKPIMAMFPRSRSGGSPQSNGNRLALLSLVGHSEGVLTGGTRMPRGRPGAHVSAIANSDSALAMSSLDNPTSSKKPLFCNSTKTFLESVSNSIW